MCELYKLLLSFDLSHIYELLIENNVESVIDLCDIELEHFLDITSAQNQDIIRIENLLNFVRENLDSKVMKGLSKRSSWFPFHEEIVESWCRLTNVFRRKEKEHKDNPIESSEYKPVDVALSSQPCLNSKDLNQNRCCKKLKEKGMFIKKNDYTIDNNSLCGILSSDSSNKKTKGCFSTTSFNQPNYAYSSSNGNTFFDRQEEAGKVSKHKANDLNVKTIKGADSNIHTAKIAPFERDSEKNNTYLHHSESDINMATNKLFEEASNENTTDFHSTNLVFDQKERNTFGIAFTENNIDFQSINLKSNKNNGSVLSQKTQNIESLFMKTDNLNLNNSNLDYFLLKQNNKELFCSKTRFVQKTQEIKNRINYFENLLKDKYNKSQKSLRDDQAITYDRTANVYMKNDDIDKDIYINEIEAAGSEFNSRDHREKIISFEDSKISHLKFGPDKELEFFEKTTKSGSVPIRPTETLAKKIVFSRNSTLQCDYLFFRSCKIHDKKKFLGKTRKKCSLKVFEDTIYKNITYPVEIRDLVPKSKNVLLKALDFTDLTAFKTLNVTKKYTDQPEYLMVQTPGNNKPKPISKKPGTIYGAEKSYLDLLTQFYFNSSHYSAFFTYSTVKTFFKRRLEILMSTYTLSALRYYKKKPISVISEKKGEHSFYHLHQNSIFLYKNLKKSKYLYILRLLLSNETFLLKQDQCFAIVNTKNLLSFYQNRFLFKKKVLPLTFEPFQKSKSLVNLNIMEFVYALKFSYDFNSISFETFTSSLCRRIVLNLKTTIDSRKSNQFSASLNMTSQCLSAVYNQMCDFINSEIIVYDLSQCLLNNLALKTKNIIRNHLILVINSSCELPSTNLHFLNALNYEWNVFQKLRSSLIDIQLFDHLITRDYGNFHKKEPEVVLGYKKNLQIDTFSNKKSKKRLVDIHNENVIYILTCKNRLFKTFNIMFCLFKTSRNTVILDHFRSYRFNDPKLCTNIKSLTILIEKNGLRSVTASQTKLDFKQLFINGTRTHKNTNSKYPLARRYQPNNYISRFSWKYMMQISLKSIKLRGVIYTDYLFEGTCISGIASKNHGNKFKICILFSLFNHSLNIEKILVYNQNEVELKRGGILLQFKRFSESLNLENRFLGSSQKFLDLQYKKSLMFDLNSNNRCFGYTSDETVTVKIHWKQYLGMHRLQDNLKNCIEKLKVYSIYSCKKADKRNVISKSENHEALDHDEFIHCEPYKKLDLTSTQNPKSLDFRIDHKLKKLLGFFQKVDEKQKVIDPLVIGRICTNIFKQLNCDKILLYGQKCRLYIDMKGFKKIKNQRNKHQLDQAATSGINFSVYSGFEDSEISKTSQKEILQSNFEDKEQVKNFTKLKSHQNSPECHTWYLIDDNDFFRCKSDIPQERSFCRTAIQKNQPRNLSSEFNQAKNPGNLLIDIEQDKIESTNIDRPVESEEYIILDESHKSEISNDREINIISCFDSQSLCNISSRNIEKSLERQEITFDEVPKINYKSSLRMFLSKIFASKNPFRQNSDLEAGNSRSVYKMEFDNLGNKTVDFIKPYINLEKNKEPYKNVVISDYTKQKNCISNSKTKKSTYSIASIFNQDSDRNFKNKNDQHTKQTDLNKFNLVYQARPGYLNKSSNNLLNFKPINRCKLHSNKYAPKDTSKPVVNLNKIFESNEKFSKEKMQQTRVEEEKKSKFKSSLSVIKSSKKSRVSISSIFSRLIPTKMSNLDSTPEDPNRLNSKDTKNVNLPVTDVSENDIIRNRLNVYHRTPLSLENQQVVKIDQDHHQVAKKSTNRMIVGNMNSSNRSIIRPKNKFHESQNHIFSSITPHYEKQTRSIIKEAKSDQKLEKPKLQNSEKFYQSTLNSNYAEKPIQLNIQSNHINDHNKTDGESAPFTQDQLESLEKKHPIFIDNSSSTKLDLRSPKAYKKDWNYIRNIFEINNGLDISHKENKKQFSIFKVETQTKLVEKNVSYFQEPTSMRYKHKNIDYSSKNIHKKVNSGNSESNKEIFKCLEINNNRRDKDVKIHNRENSETNINIQKNPLIKLSRKQTNIDGYLNNVLVLNDLEIDCGHIDGIITLKNSKTNESKYNKHNQIEKITDQVIYNEDKLKKFDVVPRSETKDMIYSEYVDSQSRSSEIQPSDIEKSIITFLNSKEYENKQTLITNTSNSQKPGNPKTPDKVPRNSSLDKISNDGILYSQKNSNKKVYSHSSHNYVSDPIYSEFTSNSHVNGNDRASVCLHDSIDTISKVQGASEFLKDRNNDIFVSDNSYFVNMSSECFPDLKTSKELKISENHFKSLDTKLVDSKKESHPQEKQNIFNELHRSSDLTISKYNRPNHFSNCDETVVSITPVSITNSSHNVSQRFSYKQPLNYQESMRNSSFKPRVVARVCSGPFVLFDGSQVRVRLRVPSLDCTVFDEVYSFTFDDMAVINDRKLNALNERSEKHEDFVDSSAQSDDSNDEKVEIENNNRLSSVFDPKSGNEHTVESPTDSILNFDSFPISKNEESENKLAKPIHNQDYRHKFQHEEYKQLKKSQDTENCQNITSDLATLETTYLPSSKIIFKNEKNHKKNNSESNTMIEKSDHNVYLECGLKHDLHDRYFKKADSENSFYNNRKKIPPYATSFSKNTEFNTSYCKNLFQREFSAASDGKDAAIITIGHNSSSKRLTAVCIAKSATEFLLDDGQAWVSVIGVGKSYTDLLFGNKACLRKNRILCEEVCVKTSAEAENLIRVGLKTKKDGMHVVIAIRRERGGRALLIVDSIGGPDGVSLIAGLQSGVFLSACNLTRCLQQAVISGCVCVLTFVPCIPALALRALKVAHGIHSMESQIFTEKIPVLDFERHPGNLDGKRPFKDFKTKQGSSKSEKCLCGCRILNYESENYHYNVFWKNINPIKNQHVNLSHFKDDFIESPDGTFDHDSKIELKQSPTDIKTFRAAAGVRKIAERIIAEAEKCLDTRIVEMARDMLIYVEDRIKKEKLGL